MLAACPAGWARLVWAGGIGELSAGPSGSPRASQQQQKRIPPRHMRFRSDYEASWKWLVKANDLQDPAADYDDDKPARDLKVTLMGGGREVGRKGVWGKGGRERGRRVKGPQGLGGEPCERRPELWHAAEFLLQCPPVYDMLAFPKLSPHPPLHSLCPLLRRSCEKPS